jgi:hypothetical protein
VPTLPNNNAIVIKDIRVVMGLELESYRAEMKDI